MGQLLLPDAPSFERKLQLIDATGLQREHEVILLAESMAQPGWKPDLVHVYGPPQLRTAMVRRIPVPYVATGHPQKRRLPWQTAPAPARELRPWGPEAVPEAVSEPFFSHPVVSRHATDRLRVGSLVRSDDNRHIINATASRIARFRDDIDWLMLDSPPGPDQLRSFALWVDPATEDLDLDGWVAEALVSGVAVVASRTPANEDRLASGRSGFLVPRADPNELAHAVLNALFKPEVRESRVAAGLQMRDRFRPEARVPRLIELYRSLIR